MLSRRGFQGIISTCSRCGGCPGVRRCDLTAPMGRQPTLASRSRGSRQAISVNTRLILPRFRVESDGGDALSSSRMPPLACGVVVELIGFRTDDPLLAERVRRDALTSHFAAFSLVSVSADQLLPPVPACVAFVSVAQGTPGARSESAWDPRRRVGEEQVVLHVTEPGHLTGRRRRTRQPGPQSRHKDAKRSRHGQRALPVSKARRSSTRSPENMTVGMHPRSDMQPDELPDWQLRWWRCGLSRHHLSRSRRGGCSYVDEDREGARHGGQRRRRVARSAQAAACPLGGGRLCNGLIEPSPSPRSEATPSGPT